MQKLFDFTPTTAAKPLSEFFNAEQCQIIRKYAQPARGYFVATFATINTKTGPLQVRRMWWLMKRPADCKRLAGKRYTYMAVEGAPSVPVNML